MHRTFSNAPTTSPVFASFPLFFSFSHHLFWYFIFFYFVKVFLPQKRSEKINKLWNVKSSVSCLKKSRVLLHEGERKKNVQKKRSLRILYEYRWVWVVKKKKVGPIRANIISSVISSFFSLSMWNLKEKCKWKRWKVKDEKKLFHFAIEIFGLVLQIETTSLYAITTTSSVFAWRFRAVFLVELSRFGWLDGQTR